MIVSTIHNLLFSLNSCKIDWYGLWNCYILVDLFTRFRILAYNIIYKRIFQNIYFSKNKLNDSYLFI